MSRRPDQCRDETLQSRYEAVEVSPGSLQKRAEALKAPRTADPDDRPNDRREVPRRDHHQVSLRDARESSQPCSSRAAGAADTSEGSFGEFAAESREFLSFRAL